MVAFVCIGTIQVAERVVKSLIHLNCAQLLLLSLFIYLYQPGLYFRDVHNAQIINTSPKISMHGVISLQHKTNLSRQRTFYVKAVHTTETLWSKLSTPASDVVRGATRACSHLCLSDSARREFERGPGTGRAVSFSPY